MKWFRSLTRSPLRLFALFLCLGVGIGLFVRLEDWSARQLMDLLNDEIISGTGGCTLRYDRIELSLIRLFATAKNVEVVCKDTTRTRDKEPIALHFDEISLQAGISKIFSRVITFNDLRLKNGYTNGVAPKSATYKFIDYLSKPVPPEVSAHKKIHLELEKLTVENSKIFEALGKNLLYGEGFNLLVTYNDKRDVILAPTVEKLSYIIRSEEEHALPLGKLTTDVQITDDKTVFHALHLGRDDHGLELKGDETINTPQSLVGDGKLSMGLTYLGIPDWLAARITGNYKVSGELGSPVLKGSFSTPEGSPAIVNPGGFEVVRFDSLSSEFVVDVNNGDPIVTLPGLQGVSNDSSLATNKIVKIENGDISGQLHLKTKNITIGSVSWNNLAADLDLSGPLSDIKSRFQGTVETAETLGATIRGINFTAESKEGVFDVHASHKAGQQGDVSFDARINAATDEALVESAKFTISKYPAFALYHETISPEQESILQISGTGEASGPFDPARVRLNAKATATSSVIPFQKDSAITLGIALGDLKLKISDSAQAFTAGLTLGLTDTKNEGVLDVQFKTKNEPPFTAFDCSQSSGSLQYTYPRKDFYSGNGSLKLTSLALGCNPVAISLASASTLPIQNGGVRMENLKLLALENPLSFSGKLDLTKQVDVAIKGLLPLQTVAPLLPSIDELAGLATVNLAMKGSLSEPQFTGTAVLQNGLLAIEKSQLLAENLSGSIDFTNAGLSFQDLKGSLNGGTLSLNGAIFPLSPELSTISAIVRGAAFTPASGFSVLSDADLSLASQEGIPTIQGTIAVLSADFEKKLDPITLAREVTALLFSSNSKSSLVESAGNKTRSKFDLPLNIKIVAKRNIFAVTNFFGAELKGDIAVQGNVSKPTIAGKVESLSGWFGLRDQRFDLTSGAVEFNGDVASPEISVTGESLVRSAAGDIVTVYLDAHGPITDPKVILSSDTGLSQRDILSLLTSTGQTMQQTAVNSLGRDYQVGGISLLAGVPILNYSKFLRYLSQVDTISIEPQFNIQTGLIEPTVSVTKNISDSMYLLGQGYLGSQVTETKIGAVYNVLPYANIAALFISASYQQNVALEINSTVTLLAQQKKFISLHVNGNAEFSTQEILKSIRLNAASRIPPEEMQNIRQGIRRFYRQNGYFDTRIQSTCESDGEYCRTIELTITEGSKSLIGSVVIDDSESSPDLTIPNDLLPSIGVGDVALTEPLVDARDDILRWLRKKGFIAARVDALYEKTNEPLKRTMLFRVNRGRNTSFTFAGNHVLSSEDFLNAINLYERKVPFGSNSINLLMDTIQQSYQELRYLDSKTTMSFETKNPGASSSPIAYTITIDEGPHYTLTKAKFAQISSDEEALILKQINKQGPTFYKSIFYPSSILPDALEIHAKELIAIARTQGYDTAAVSVDLEKNEEATTVAPVYTFNLGERSPGVEVSVALNNPSIQYPKPPHAPVYTQELREYSQEVEKSLLEQGYRSVGFSEEHPAPGLLVLHVDEGPVTEAGSVMIIGNQDISEETIKDLLHIVPGEPLQLQNIRAMKQKLLNRGLFSRVDIEEVDSGDSTIKNLQIRVVEKPLNTLDVGGGYNTEFGAHVFAEGTDRSLFKDGRSLTLRLDAYVNSPNGDQISRGIAAIKYTHPDLLETRYVLTEDLRYQKLNAPTQEFNLDRGSLTSGLYRSWDSGLSLSAAHTILDENVTDVSPDVILDGLDSGNVQLSYLSTTISLDKRDNPLNPFSGYSLTYDARLSDPTLGSDASYWGTGLRATNTIPITIGENTFAIAQSLRGAISESFGDDPYVPITQRYYLGGRNSVRGYQENSLGPRGKDGGTLGGESLLAGSLEFQYRPYESLSINLFADAGNVYLSSYNAKANDVPDSIRKEDEAFLRYSTGIGLKFLSPIGPIGLDLGFPVNGREEDAPWRLHFNIGSNF